MSTNHSKEASLSYTGIARQPGPAAGTAVPPVAAPAPAPLVAPVGFLLAAPAEVLTGAALIGQAVLYHWPAEGASPRRRSARPGVGCSSSGCASLASLKPDARSSYGPSGSGRAGPR